MQIKYNILWKQSKGYIKSNSIKRRINHPLNQEKNIEIWTNFNLE